MLGSRDVETGHSDCSPGRSLGGVACTNRVSISTFKVIDRELRTRMWPSMGLQLSAPEYRKQDQKTGLKHVFAPNHSRRVKAFLLLFVKRSRKYVFCLVQLLAPLAFWQQLLSFFREDPEEARPRKKALHSASSRHGICDVVFCPSDLPAPAASGS